MTPRELKAIAKTMKDLGITHLKTDTYELTMPVSATQWPKPPIQEKPKELVPPKPPPKDQKDLDPKEEEKIVHKLEELKSIMSLGDVELLDRLFPAVPDEGQETHDEDSAWPIQSNQLT